MLVLVLAACGKKAESGAGSASGAGPGSASASASAPASASASAPAPAPASAPAPAPGASASAIPEPLPDTSLGVNIALAALGGRVIAPVEPADRDPVWRVANLIDGFPLIRGVGAIGSSFGWMPAPDVPAFPYELVLGFRADRETTISAVVVDTASNDNVAGPAGVPKDVEIWTSTMSPASGFTKVAATTLPQAAGENVIKLAGARARYVKLVIASSYDAGVRPQLGEVQIYEANDVPSIVVDAPRNLLLPALGGSLVRFTSQDRDGEAYRLVDGELGDRTGWVSAAAEPGQTTHFPQEFTFAFRDQRTAAIERVELEPTSGLAYSTGDDSKTSTWPRTIEIQTGDAREAFQTVRTVTVGTDGKTIRVPIGKPVRFLRVRILDNNGNEHTTFGEIRAFEAAGPTILAGRGVPLERANASTIAAGGEAAARREKEPNNTRAEADRLDAPAPVGGTITPTTDRDIFVVPAAAQTGKQTVTVSVEGRPAIRARVSVIDGGGVTRHQLDPTHAAGPTARFSVVTDAGDVALSVVQPPAAQVVIWDTSGSMEQRVADLDRALHAYLAQLTPDDRVQLVRFDDTIDVLMKDFTGDKAALVDALKDKVYANGGTSIYDAITRGLDTLDRRPGSRAIVMLTDGEDTTSALDPSAFWRALDEGGTRLYTIGLGNGLRNYVVRAGATAERVLANAAVQTGGRYEFVADSAKLGAMYAEIGAELRAPATYAIAATAVTGNGTVAVTSIGDQLAVPPRVELVLDASGSMKRKAGAGSMMDAAKAVLIELVQKLPASATVAMRVYGHRVPEGRPGACEDSELVVPFGVLDRKQLTATIKKVSALGTTPIAYSLTQAGGDLADAKGATMLIVVTDGKEECGGDPAAAITALRASGLAVTLNIVGFGLAEADRGAMTRVATAGGGRFFDAQGAAGLRAAVDQAMAVPFGLVDASGQIVARGIVGGPPVTAPAGDLSIRLATAATPVTIDHVVVAPGKLTTVELNKDGDQVAARIGAPGNTP